jgi:hypothetical protein
MIEDGNLVYDYNYYGDHHLLRSSIPVPAGCSHVAMRFTLDGDGTAGTAELFIDNEPVGKKHLAETFEHFVSWQGLDVGADRLSPARHDPDSGAFAFAGELSKLEIELLDGHDRRPYEPQD